MNKFCVFWRARTAAANCSYLEFNSYTTQIYAAAKFDAKIYKTNFYWTLSVASPCIVIAEGPYGELATDHFYKIQTLSNC